MLKLKIVWILSIISLVVSCRKGTDILPQKATGFEDLVYSSSSKVFIVNEGNYGWGNGGLSLYLPDSLKSFPDYFSSISNLPLGDVPQSISHHDGIDYITVNNSGKIIELDLKNGLIYRELTGLISPRYLLPVDPNKAYVSDLYANGIAVVSLESFTQIDFIPINAWTEKMLKINEEVWVCSPSSKYVYVINESENSLEDSVMVGEGSNSIHLLNNAFVYVLISGGFQEDVPAIVKIDPRNKTVVLRKEIDAIDASPTDLVVNKDSTGFLFLSIDVYALSRSLLENPFKVYEADNKTFYGLNTDPRNGDIYVCDAKDYVQQGEVFRLNNTFQLIDSFPVGINPSFIHFISE